MRIKKRLLYGFVVVLIIIGGLYYWYSANEEPPPERKFSTRQLLIPSLPGWGIYSGPEDMPVDKIYLAWAIAWSEIRFMKPPVGIEQWTPVDVNKGKWEQIADVTEWVVKFSTNGHAGQAYREHYWVPDDTQNPFLSSPWQPLKGLNYQSHIANQFRIVCNSDRQLVAACDIEAQYDEFYILASYSSVNKYNDNNLIGDLKTIASAIDAQMEKYLVPQK